MLAKLNLKAEFAGDGQQAAERVALGGIDLVLMDLQMPEVDGLEGTRRIRSGAHQPYIVALTAFAFSSHQRECEAAGMNDFLTKPIRLPELQASLERFEGFRQAVHARPATAGHAAIDTTGAAAQTSSEQPLPSP
ncbi:response regulator [Synechococcus sp. ATX 2A4]|uniref:response regulator n=1 Tax=Synechococcus sp. ATX 2A4 TaxID=2823727 RepID=UPI0020CB8DC1|nr:response regulator [Synechococcus sp. ATX 2A4]MCP9884017.1 response regulator [Synechococcus sp. ATX 2A4]